MRRLLLWLVWRRELDRRRVRSWWRRNVDRGTDDWRR